MKLVGTLRIQFPCQHGLYSFWDQDSKELLKLDHISCSNYRTIFSSFQIDQRSKAVANSPAFSISTLELITRNQFWMCQGSPLFKWICQKCSRRVKKVLSQHQWYHQDHLLTILYFLLVQQPSANDTVQWLDSSMLETKGKMSYFGKGFHGWPSFILWSQTHH
jgi:hypothetical protein